MFNGANSSLDIHTSEPSIIIIKQDTFFTENNKVELALERKRQTVEVTAMTDSTNKKIELDPRLSPALFMNFIFPYAFIAERHKERAYVYPKSIFLNMSDTLPIYFQHFIPAEKELYFNVSIPYLNNFFFQPFDDGNFKSRTGLLGLGLGVEYHYKKNRFWAVNVNANSDEIIPGERKYEEFYAVAFSFSNNHRRNRYTYGYGLTFAFNNWRTNQLLVGERSPTPFLSPLQIENSSIGGRFSVYRQLKENFHFGLVYRPTIFQVAPKVKFKYEQVISVDLAWKLKINN